MRFLMFVCTDTEAVEAPTTPVPDIEEWVSTMDGRGIRITGDPLVHERNAKTVRVRGGKKAVTDGPFLETKEVLGGYYVLEAPDLDAAVAIAKDIPEPTVEVRPIVA
jgi:hypothetical protein